MSILLPLTVCCILPCCFPVFHDHADLVFPKGGKHASIHSCET